ncbi:enoyl-CoA hydratase/isomerase family protein [Radiobacillus sp. PE A8.2]|uniref:enoyl-CoA hydratase/isomerase family protein n=1 Tax=Radiobacillus sp. PE A8.2 TaxID=3380349 RepID=UPI00388DC10F
MSFEFIKVAKESGIGFVTLNRPEKLNAMPEPMWLELADAVNDCSSDEAIKVIVLKAAGKSFSAGFDISGDPYENVQRWYEHAKIGNTAPYAIWNSPKPVIAQVQGHCLGGANSLAMSCDLIVASAEAKFGEPEVRFGTFSPFFILPWMVNAKKAKELLLTGDLISAEEAKEIGIVNKVVKAEDLEMETRYLAEKIKRNDNITNESIKQLTNRIYEIQGFLNSMKVGEEQFAMVAASEKPLAEAFIGLVGEKGFKKAQEIRMSEIESNVEKTVINS